MNPGGALALMLTHYCVFLWEGKEGFHSPITGLVAIGTPLLIGDEIAVLVWVYMRIYSVTSSNLVSCPPL